MESLDTSAIRVDSGSTTPPFEQVRAHIAGLIASGTLPAGAKLPTVRELARSLGLATNTAARVYRELESDGLVATGGRRGTFVSSEVTRAGASSDVAVRARAAAAEFTSRVRQLGLTRSEAIQLVERSWNGG
jgi:DNA-binding transcriptional regulator YhcF (GntR family)